MGLESVLIVIFLFLSLAVVGLILIQHGKGADAGAAFGSGASATVFGSQGSANFLSRTTAVLGTVWFLLALILAWFAIQATDTTDLLEGSVMDAVTPAVEVPVADTPVPAPVVTTTPAEESVVPPPEAAVPAESAGEAVVPPAEMPASENKPGE